MTFRGAVLIGAALFALRGPIRLGVAYGVFGFERWWKTRSEVLQMADEPRFYETVLTARQRAFLLAAAKRSGYQAEYASERPDAVRALEQARPTDLLPGRIDWEEAERRARERGGTVLDLIWDEAKGKEPDA